MECQVRNSLMEVYLRSQADLEIAEEGWEHSGQANHHLFPTAVALARQNVMEPAHRSN